MSDNPGEGIENTSGSTSEAKVAPLEFTGDQTEPIISTNTVAQVAPFSFEDQEGQPTAQEANQAHIAELNSFRTTDEYNTNDISQQLDRVTTPAPQMPKIGEGFAMSYDKMMAPITGADTQAAEDQYQKVKADAVNEFKFGVASDINAYKTNASEQNTTNIQKGVADTTGKISSTADKIVDAVRKVEAGLNSATAFVGKALETGNKGITWLRGVDAKFTPWVAGGFKSAPLAAGELLGSASGIAVEAAVLPPLAIVEGAHGIAIAGKELILKGVELARNFKDSVIEIGRNFGRGVERIAVNLGRNLGYIARDLGTTGRRIGRSFESKYIPKAAGIGIANIANRAMQGVLTYAINKVEGSEDNVLDEDIKAMLQLGSETPEYKDNRGELQQKKSELTAIKGFLTSMKSRSERSNLKRAQARDQLRMYVKFAVPLKSAPAAAPQFTPIEPDTAARIAQLNSFRNQPDVPYQTSSVLSAA